MERKLLNVANASGKDIYVMIDADRPYVTLRDFGSSVSIFGFGAGYSNMESVEEQRHWAFAEKHGFTKIQKGSYLGFDANTDATIVYVTIVSDRHVVCHCFPHDYQYGLIVDTTGYLKEAEEGSIWKDRDGKNHEVKK